MPFAWGAQTDLTFGASQTSPIGPSLTTDLQINKANPGIVLIGSESNARQCEVREVGGVLYMVNNATFNGTNWVCVNTAAEADGFRIDSAGNWQKIYTAATAGNITWTVLWTVNAAAGDMTVVGKIIAPTIGPVSGQQHTLPAVASDTIALLAAVQILTNKTLTGNIAVTLGPTAGQQHTFPAVASDTIALLAAAQTFTNKTLTAPTVNSPVINNGVAPGLVVTIPSAVQTIPFR